jgi:hypothetical protein
MHNPNRVTELNSPGRVETANYKEPKKRSDRQPASQRPSYYTEWMVSQESENFSSGNSIARRGDVKVSKELTQNQSLLCIVWGGIALACFLLAVEFAPVIPGYLFVFLLCACLLGCIFSAYFAVTSISDGNWNSAWLKIYLIMALVLLSILCWQTLIPFLRTL